MPYGQCLKVKKQPGATVKSRGVPHFKSSSLQGKKEQTNYDVNPQ